ncbi:MAG: DUF6152 family protein [Xanthobacteraceae bacterium]
MELCTGRLPHAGGTQTRAIVLLSLLALLAGAASAHHGWGSYDATRSVTVNGPIVTSKFENPQPYRYSEDRRGRHDHRARQ